MSQTIIRSTEHKQAPTSAPATRSLVALVGAAALATAVVYLFSLVIGRIA
jgi:hypothetical protein